MSDLNARLNQLASRGTPRGADAVLDAAKGAASLGVIEGERADDDTDDDFLHDGIPLVSAEPTRRPRRRFSSMIAAAGMAAMLLVGTLAISALVGSGGANSPEGAVRRLADAVHDGDPLAAANVMSPSEVRSLTGTVRTAEKKAAEMQLVHKASEPLSGVDLSVEGLQLTATPLADGYAKVSVDDGVLHASTKKAKFSTIMQKVLRNTDDNKTDIDLAQLASATGVGTFVVTVREEGHWYVSAAYTALEYLREYNHVQAEPHFGSGMQAVSTLGADSPDAAVKNGIEALAHNNWDSLLALAPPDEIPVYDYRDVLKELITQNQASTDFTVDAIATKSDVHGDTASVVVDAHGTSSGNKWSLQGGCYTPPVDQSGYPAGYNPKTCVGNASDPISLFYGIAGVYSSGVNAATSPTQGISTVEHNGRWFVSPVGSVLDVVDNWMNTIDRRNLYLMLGIGDQLPPDGNLVLGQPVAIKKADHGAAILTFQGTKGEKLLGVEDVVGTKIAPDGFSSGIVPAYVRAYAPDGRELTIESAFYAQPVELPADGTYKFIIAGNPQFDVNVTFWNEKDAPAKARTSPDGSTCTFDQPGASSCSTSSQPAGVQVLPGEVPIGGPVSTVPVHGG